MAALIGQIRRGEVTPGETVVFLHTGGAPALFAQAERLAAVVASQRPVVEP
jgi:1-aminocyclopropane-1-carboxylate deaminase/D-cysteine desulfhydrase-like pyridoxal-dependent ACC family enzyme